MPVFYISLQWTCAETKRWCLLQRLPFHQNVIATREMFCCDLAFGFQLHAARNLAPVQNIPSTLQATEGWGRLFFMALFYSRSMPAPRPAMINAGYTDTTHVWLVIGHKPWKMTNIMTCNQWGRLQITSNFGYKDTIQRFDMTNLRHWKGSRSTSFRLHLFYL